MDQRSTLIAYACAYAGNADRITRAILKKEPVVFVPEPPCITRIDPEYPACLRALKDPPWVLFYRGDPGLLTLPKLAVVGSRLPNPYSAKMTERLVQEAAKRYVIVSGLAKGIDAIAHRSAIKIGRTIAVLGSGIDTVYPKENAELYRILARDQLILSEYPPGTMPLRPHFPARNRIIAALGSSLVVMQAGLKSGSMITVNHALALGKEVICLPHPLGDPLTQGSNELIRQGADILTSEADFAKL